MKKYKGLRANRQNDGWDTLERRVFSYLPWGNQLSKNVRARIWNIVLTIFGVLLLLGLTLVLCSIFPWACIDDAKPLMRLVGTFLILITMVIEEIWISTHPD